MASEAWEKYYRKLATKHREAAEWLCGDRCAHCKTSEGPFEFDHINSTTKSFTIGAKLHYSWKKLYPELRKCQLLCKPCHYEKTAKSGPSNKGQITHGKAYPALRLRCDCDSCKDYKTKRNASRRISNITRITTRELIHGTRAGYQKEKRRGLKPCIDCRKANSEDTKRRKLNLHQRRPR